MHLRKARNSLIGLLTSATRPFVGFVSGSEFDQVHRTSVDPAVFKKPSHTKQLTTVSLSILHCGKKFDRPNNLRQLWKTTHNGRGLYVSKHKPYMPRILTRSSLVILRILINICRCLESRSMVLDHGGKGLYFHHYFWYATSPHRKLQP
jgi:hypothetical protein